MPKQARETKKVLNDSTEIKMQDQVRQPGLTAYNTFFGGVKKIKPRERKKVIRTTPRTPPLPAERDRDRKKFIQIDITASDLRDPVALKAKYKAAIDRARNEKKVCQFYKAGTKTAFAYYDFKTNVFSLKAAAPKRLEKAFKAVASALPSGFIQNYTGQPIHVIDIKRTIARWYPDRLEVVQNDSYKIQKLNRLLGDVIKAINDRPLRLIINTSHVGSLKRNKNNGGQTLIINSDAAKQEDKRKFRLTGKNKKLSHTLFSNIANKETTTKVKAKTGTAGVFCKTDKHPNPSRLEFYKKDQQNGKHQELMDYVIARKELAVKDLDFFAVIPKSIRMNPDITFNFAGILEYSAKTGGKWLVTQEQINSDPDLLNKIEKLEKIFGNLLREIEKTQAAENNNNNNKPQDDADSFPNVQFEGGMEAEEEEDDDQALLAAIVKELTEGRADNTLSKKNVRDVLTELRVMRAAAAEAQAAQNAYSNDPDNNNGRGPKRS